jgi:hypothetical protein
MGLHMQQIRKLLKQIPGAKRMAQALGFIPEDRRSFLFALLPKNAIGVEIGVHLGDFSEQLLNRLNPKELHLIDPWKYEGSDTYSKAWYGGLVKGGQAELDARYKSVLRRFRSPINAGRMHIHRGTSEEIGQNFSDEYFDWVYIDGNHLYEFVRKDLELYIKKLKVGGYIAGDDYIEGDWWEGGVKKAVDEFITSKGVQLIEIKNTQFLIQKTA